MQSPARSCSFPGECGSSLASVCPVPRTRSPFHRILRAPLTARSGVGIGPLLFRALATSIHVNLAASSARQRRLRTLATQAGESTTLPEFLNPRRRQPVRTQPERKAPERLLCRVAARAETVEHLRDVGLEVEPSRWRRLRNKRHDRRARCRAAAARVAQPGQPWRTRRSRARSVASAESRASPVMVSVCQSAREGIATTSWLPSASPASQSSHCARASRWTCCSGRSTRITPSRTFPMRSVATRWIASAPRRRAGQAPPAPRRGSTPRVPHLARTRCARAGAPGRPGRWLG